MNKISHLLCKLLSILCFKHSQYLPKGLAYQPIETHRDPAGPTGTYQNARGHAWWWKFLRKCERRRRKKVWFRSRHQKDEDYLINYLSLIGPKKILDKILDLVNFLNVVHYQPIILLKHVCSDKFGAILSTA